MKKTDLLLKKKTTTKIKQNSRKITCKHNHQEKIYLKTKKEKLIKLIKKYIKINYQEN